MIEYKTIEKTSEGFLEISKSRFLTHINHVETEEEAQEFIQSIKKKYFDARHNCYAYIIGERSQIQKSSDDGEPSGTAGVPILEVLKKNELSDIVVVVTRYFGGIKLGAGGLIRAYGKATTTALDNGVIVKKTIFNRYELHLDYSLIGTLENYLHKQEIRIEDKAYTDKVVFTILLPPSTAADDLTDITNLTSGRCQINELEPIYLNIPTK